jgi:hypothetical protein
LRGGEQAVASRGAVAIRELGKITEDPSPKDALALAALLKELGDAAEGGSPRFTPPESVYGEECTFEGRRHRAATSKALKEAEQGWQKGDR